MAGERIATWKIVAQFSQARREARSLEKDLASAERAQHRFNKSSDEASKSDDQRQRTVSELISKVADLNRVQRDAADGNKRAAAAVKILGDQEGKLAVARQRLEAATLAQSRAEIGLTEAKTRLTRAEKDAEANSFQLQRARNELTLAEGRLASATKQAAATRADADKKAGASTSVREAAESRAAAAATRAQQAEVRVSAARLRVAQVSENSSQRVQRAQQGVAEAVARVASAESRAEGAAEGLRRAQERAGSGGGGLISNFRRLSSEFDGAGAAARRLVSFLGLLKFPAIILGIRELLAALSALSGGLFAVASAVAPAVGALASLPQLFSVAASGVGALVLAFGGVGNALKAYGAAQKAAGKESNKAANTEVSNAKAIRDAQRGVADAREQQARAAQDAADSVSSAERGVADAQQEAVRAQQAVNDAREQAKRDLEDLSQQVKDYALTEERASLSVEQARQALLRTKNDPNASALDRKDADLSYREALARQAEIQRQAKAAAAELKKAQKDGIDGSKVVIAARQQQADADRAVIDAQRTLSKAVRDSGRSQRDSAEGVQKAVEALAAAQQKQAGGSSAASSAADQYAEALKKLTPEGRAFVKQLLSMQPLLKKLRATAERGILPGVTDALKRSTGLFPIVNKGLDLISRSIGNTAKQGGILINSGPFKRDFATLFKSNAGLADSFGRSLLNIIDTLRNVTLAAIPLTTWLVRVAEGWTKTARAAAQSGRDTGKLQGFFEETRKTLGKLGQIFGGLIKGLINVGKAGYDTGQSILDTYVRLTAQFEAFTRSAEGQNKIRKWFEDIRPALSEIGKLVGAVGLSFLKLGADKSLAPLLKQIRTDLLPAIGKLGEAVSGNFGTALVGALTKLVDIFAELAQSGGGLTAFLKVLTVFLDVLGDVISVVPGSTQALGIFLAVMGGFRALNLVFIVSGMKALVKQIGLLGAASAGKNASQLSKFAEGIKRLGGIANNALLPLGRLGFLIKSGLVVGAIIGSVYLLNRALDQFRVKIGTLAPNVDGLSSSLGDMGKSVDDVLPGLDNNLKHLNASINKNFTIEEQKKQWESFFSSVDQGLSDLVNNGQISEAATRFKQISDEAKAQNISVDELQKLLPNYTAAVKKAGDENKTTSGAMSETTGAAKQQKLSIDDLVNVYDKLNGKNIDVAQSQIEFRRSLGDITESVKTNGKAIDGNSTAALNNRDAILRAYQAAEQNAKAYADSTGKAGDFDKALRSNVGELEKQLRKAGLTKEQIAKLTAEYGKVPGDVKTQLDANEKLAWSKIQETKRRLADPKLTRPERSVLDIEKKRWDRAYAQAVEEKRKLGLPVVVTASMQADARKTARVSVGRDKLGNINEVRFANGVVARASGGRIYGPGTETSDSIPALLSNNEHVLSAKEVRGFGGHESVERLRAMARNGALPKFATGGAVGPYFAKLTSGLKPALTQAANSMNDTILVQTAKTVAKEMTEGLLGGSAGIGKIVPGLKGALDFAKAQAGKPYIWGSSGPQGYDCSGFMSAIADVAEGLKPYTRLFATGSFGGPSVDGFQRNLDSGFRIGVVHGNPGHTAGTLNGVNVESRGGEGVVIGPRARGANNPLFTMHYGLKGFAKGGAVLPGDPPFDLINPYGKKYKRGLREELVQQIKDGVRFFARGGSVSDTVPAMLTPGEFVIRRDAAKKIGPERLHALNNADKVQHFHAGGPVRGVTGPGNRGYWVNELWAMEGAKLPIPTSWTADLTNRLRAGFPKLGAGVLKNTEPKHWDAIAAVLNSSKTPGGAGLVEVMNKLNYGLNSAVNAFVLGHSAISKKVSNNKRNRFFTEADTWRSRLVSYTKDLQRVIGTPQSGRLSPTDMSGLTHILDHALKIPHDQYLDRPWGPLDAAETAARDQVRANEISAEYRKYLVQFATWGYQDLVQKLFDLGPADGMEIARAAAKDKTKASQLDAAYKEAKKFTGDDALDTVKFIGAISASATPLGIRDLARQLQIPDYAVLQLYDKAKSTMGSIPASKLSRLLNEMNLFRQGLFYANSGGRVPGAGSRDTVPAMLTPGEFVIRKRAAEALGPETLQMLNHFAAGGPVLGMNAPSVPRLSPITRNSTVSDSNTRVVNNNYEFNTTIVNPVGENSVASMNRSLKRKASLGIFGSED